MVVGAVAVALAVVAGCGSDEPAAPSLPTTFGPYPSTGLWIVVPGRDIEPGLYRTAPVGSSWCNIRSPYMPGQHLAEIAPDEYRTVGSDGLPMVILVPRQGVDFTARQGV